MSFKFKFSINETIQPEGLKYIDLNQNR